MNNKITPVFYIGFNRNGTTWLGNTISQNFDVASVEHPLHYGALESTIYSYHRYFGDFTNLDKYLAFLEVFSASDFFLATGISKEHFYKRKYDNFYYFFLDLMDTYCQSKNKMVWITKLDPNFFMDIKELLKFLDIIERRYDSVKFISIQREFDGYIASKQSLSLKNLNDSKRWKSYLMLPYSAAQYFYLYKKINKFIKENNGITLQFIDLKQKYYPSISGISDYLGISKNEIPDQFFIQNTSFQTGTREKKISYWFAELIFDNISLLSWGMCKLAFFRYNVMPKQSPMWWKFKKADHFYTEFCKELKTNKELKLLDYIVEKKEHIA